MREVQVHSVTRGGNNACVCKELGKASRVKRAAIEIIYVNDLQGLQFSFVW